MSIQRLLASFKSSSYYIPPFGSIYVSTRWASSYFKTRNTQQPSSLTTTSTYSIHGDRKPMTNHDAVYNTQQLHPQQMLVTSDYYSSINDETKCCYDCKQRFSKLHPLLKLAKRKSLGGHRVCIGCIRLFGPYYANDEGFKFAIKSELLLSSLKRQSSYYYPSYSSISATTNTVFVQKTSGSYYSFTLEEQFFKEIAERRRDKMVSRFNTVYGIPSGSQIVDLLRKSQGVCAISGIKGLWLPGGLNPFCLTLDHIVPASKGGSLGIENLQVVISCINQLKADQSNDETIRFLIEFQKNNKTGGSNNSNFLYL